MFRALIRFIRLSLCLITLLAGSFQSFGQSSSLTTVTFSSNLPHKEQLQYLFYKSKGPGKRPLLVYLHGTRSKGGSIDNVKKTGLPKLIEEGKIYPFDIIAPHLTGNMNWSTELIEQFVTHVTTQQTIDLDRVYITGISIGAAAAFDYTCDNPNKVAAVIAISGWGNPEVLCNMKDVPAWIFHATDDNIVSISGARNVAQTLYACRGNVILHEFPEGKHDISYKSYSYPELFDWMLAKSKKADIREARIKFDSATIGYKLPRALEGITGIWASSKGELYGINSKATRPVIISFDTLGHVKQMHTFQQTSNWSWQDITANETGELIIADVGNENFKRETYQLYKFPITDFEKERISPKMIEFTLKTGKPLHFKSIFCIGEYVYLFGEDSDKDVFLIEVPLNQGDKTEGTLVMPCKSIMSEQISSAFYDHTTKTLFILGTSTIGVFPLKTGIQDITEKDASYLPLHNSTKKEAITLLPNGYLAYADRLFYGTKDGNLYIRRFP